MRQNNVEKALKECTHNTRGGKERAPQLKTSVNPATASTKKYEEFCLWLFEQLFFTHVCVWLMYTKICGFVWSIFADAKGTT